VLEQEAGGQRAQVGIVVDDEDSRLQVHVAMGGIHAIETSCELSRQFVSA
jgi:hypothetical protein